ncbi:hypothetical protein AVEN_199468-1 [Araneus ventricosus]|uniref:Uncharacterized protein n=1 Tax=Araneus ventricosus TaxID=182803 RepID=A0A4Y2LDR1_ARAVE|nr:hypothetical protein AVEN_199468-1 [Araneus ventricosus]
MPRASGCYTLLGSVVDGAAEPEHLPMSFVVEANSSIRYMLISTPNTFHTVSPFMVQKLLTSCIGEIQNVKLRSGDLLVQIDSKQASVITCLISWNWRGFLSKVCLFKDLIYEVHTVCITLQETYLKPADIPKIKHYSLVRKDDENESGRASGGVALLVSHDTPSSVITLHSNLQAVVVSYAFQFSNCFPSYLPPSTNVNERSRQISRGIAYSFYHWGF